MLIIKCTAILSYLAIAIAHHHHHHETPVFQLNNGHVVPVVGLGTGNVKPEVVEHVVKDAIDVGYRHFDTAYSYGNEREIGHAINAKIDEGVIKREDIFVTTKLWSTFHQPEFVERQFLRSFENLNISYIDLLLIHYPISYGLRHKDGSDKVPFQVDDVVLIPYHKNGSVVYADVDLKETWHTLEKLVESGRVRSIGVSNFNSQQVEYVLSFAHIKPVMNQIEIHPNLSQLKFIDFLKSRGVEVTAYSPLGRPDVVHDSDMAFKHPIVHGIASKYHKSAAQIILRYLYQVGVVVIPRSVNRNHLVENIDLWDFTLSHEDMEALKGLDNHHRIVKFEHDVHHKNYPFRIEY